jgi:hypothetical protein
MAGTFEHGIASCQFLTRQEMSLLRERKMCSVVSWLYSVGLFREDSLHTTAKNTIFASYLIQHRDETRNRSLVRGSFQKFCTLCVFSLKWIDFTKYIYRPSIYSPLCFITEVQRLGKSCIPVWTPSFLMRLITQVTSLDTSLVLLKRFPRSQILVGSAHQNLTCSQNWRNHSVGNA